MNTVGHWLLHITGADNLNGWIYGLWSGVGGSNLLDLPMWAGVVMYLRHHQCHQRGCLRIGHPVNGKPWCRKHHPDG